MILRERLDNYPPLTEETALLNCKPAQAGGGIKCSYRRSYTIALSEVSPDIWARPGQHH